MVNWKRVLGLEGVSIPRSAIDAIWKAGVNNRLITFQI
jgi:hypothetical protein